MQFIPTADIKMDMTRPLEELKQLILTISLTQSDQLQFFNSLDLWIGETSIKIEEFQQQQTQLLH